MSKQEFIWYCPRDRCRFIITKTSSPILNEKKIFHCVHCNCKFTGTDLMLNNKKNLKKFYDNLKKNPVDNFAD